jgi:hypothetical protein
MQDAMMPLGKHPHLVWSVLKQLVSSLLPANRLAVSRPRLTLQAIGRAQREQQPRAHHMHPHCLRAAWPQYISQAVVSRSLASTMPMHLAGPFYAWAMTLMK